MEERICERDKFMSRVKSRGIVIDGVSDCDEVICVG